MKNKLLYFAMFLLIICFAFRGNEEGVRWLWADITSIPLTLMFFSLMCIALYLYEQRRKERINEEKN